MLMFRSTKHPQAKNVLTFDFSLGLAAGETLTGTPTVTVETLFGTDAAPAALLNGSAVLSTDALSVLVPVKAGVDGVQYKITVVVGTSNTLKTLAMTAALAVRS